MICNRHAAVPQIVFGDGVIGEEYIHALTQLSNHLTIDRVRRNVAVFAGTLGQVVQLVFNFLPGKYLK